jgi:hypothetical protein
MLRIASFVLTILVALVAALPGGVLAAPAHAPKVVLIVGPAGAATDGYRVLADDAAAAARQFTPNVVKVYSPDATWPAVRRALDGASVVVYLGHGNGWPSRYRDSLFPPSENGFGLNPTAGGGDDAHQYFGEERIAADVKLAKNAVVVLSHLCYASGNTEPGLPEGTIADARQRIDNYAAGFIAAGASAVIAEGHLGPAYYVRALLAEKGSVARIWNGSPTAKGHTTTFASVRSPGYTAMLDPDHPGSGFYRSIVLRSGTTSEQLNQGAQGVTTDVAPADPTLSGVGLELGTLYLADRPVAGTKTQLKLPYTVARGKSLPAGVSVAVRWDPIDVPGPGAAAAMVPAADAATPSTSPSPSATPSATVTPAGPAPTSVSRPVARRPDQSVAERPVSTAQPDASDPSLQPVSLVAPERLGSLVDPKRATIGRTRIAAPVSIPTQPGRYRLVVTLHDATGVAFDAATQALIKGVFVRVTGETAVEYLVTDAATAQAGAAFDLPVGVANLGTKAWGHVALTVARRGGDTSGAAHAVLVGRWIALNPDPATTAPPPVVADLPAGLAPAAVARVVLDGTAPTTAGEYLLMLDVVVPERGSLASAGLAPALVRVTVKPG